jgi:ribose transport system ATP-binding protein
MNTAPLLQVAGLSKAFAAPVLKQVQFAVAAGEIVALTGENGAGKSTLSKIIAGLQPPDAGSMSLGGATYRPASRAQAERLGVRMVLQELGLIGTLSVAENLQLGNIPSRAGFVRRTELLRAARAQLALVGLDDVDPALAVSELGIGQQQLVEIARGLLGDIRLLILDEPTAMLTAPEVDTLFAQLAQLRSRDVGVIYISHRLDELSRIADRIVVLRDGALVADRPSAGFAQAEVVRAMIGHDPVADENRPRRTAGAPVLRVAGLGRGSTVRNVSFTLHSGEILGVAGLVGSGRTELLRLIFGADRGDSGSIYLDAGAAPVAIDSPMRAVARGIGLLTEDRKAQGLLLSQSLTDNATIADLRAVSRRGWLDRALAGAAFEHWSRRLRIRARDGEQAAAELSGGNQQKLLLARWLHRGSRILLLDEPTRGIDIGARADIYAQLDALAAAGKALLLVSSDLRELMLVCDRIAVLSAGALVAIFERGEWSEAGLLAAAFSGYAGTARAGRAA